MKTATKMAAQGDVLFRRVKAIPAGFAEKKREGALIVSHSETGHHHSIHDNDVRCFEPVAPSDGLVCYLQMDGTQFDVVHHRNYDTHETIRLLGVPGDIWEVRRQREHTPEGWRRVQD